jgi:hypothetical protein
MLRDQIRSTPGRTLSQAPLQHYGSDIIGPLGPVSRVALRT